MNKIFFVSESSLDNDWESTAESFWFTVVYDQKQSEDDADINPWTQTKAVIRKNYYLSDDCVVTIRPARAIDGYSVTKDHYKGYYFIEIMNQDESVKHSSRKVYLWEQVIEYASWFKGMSFPAAQRIWKVKKL